MVTIRAAREAAVGVIKQTLPGFECPLQRLADLPGLQPVVDIMSNDLARRDTGYQTKVNHTFVGRQVRDVGNPRR